MKISQWPENRIFVLLEKAEKFSITTLFKKSIYLSLNGKDWKPILERESIQNKMTIAISMKKSMILFFGSTAKT